MISSPSVSSVTSSGIVRSRTWMVVSKSISDSTEYSIDCGQVVRQGADADGLARVEERAALELDGRRFAGRDERDVDRQLLGHADEEEVHVEGPPVDRMDLDRRDEDRARLRPVDRQVDQRVRAAVAPKLLEFVGIDRDAGRVDAVAVDDGRKAAGTAESWRPSCRSMSRCSAASVARAVGMMRNLWIGCCQVRAAARRRGRNWRGARSVR